MNHKRNGGEKLSIQMVYRFKKSKEWYDFWNNNVGFYSNTNLGFGNIIASINSALKKCNEQNMPLTIYGKH